MGPQWEPLIMSVPLDARGSPRWQLQFQTLHKFIYDKRSSPSWTASPLLHPHDVWPRGRSAVHHRLAAILCQLSKRVNCLSGDQWVSPCRPAENARWLFISVRSSTMCGHFILTAPTVNQKNVKDQMCVCVSASDESEHFKCSPSDPSFCHR